MRTVWSMIGTGFSNGNGNTWGTYDYENRPVTDGVDYFSYGPDNLRVWKIRSDGSQDVYFYDPAGRKIAVYQVSKPTNFQTYCICGSITTEWFAGEILNTDRLGSTTPTFPYGEPYQTPLQDGDFFATYYHDIESGFDYAKNRFYYSTQGRFLTPDPYVASVGPTDPGSWNRYTYARNDPVDRKDPSGLFDENGDAPNYDTGVPGAGCVLGDCLRRRYPYLSPQQIDPNTGIVQVVSKNFAKYNAEYKQRTANALTNLNTNCQKASGATNLGKVTQDVPSLDYFDATQLPEGNLTQNQVANNGDNTTLAQTVSDTAAAVLTGANGLPTNDIILGPQFLSASTTIQNAVLLVHEALHAGLKLNDVQLANLLLLPNDGTILDASQQISNFLASDCPHSMQTQ
jgi:RHS repeat-associated protein